MSCKSCLSLTMMVMTMLLWTMMGMRVFRACPRILMGISPESLLCYAFPRELRVTPDYHSMVAGIRHVYRIFHDRVLRFPHHFCMKGSAVRRKIIPADSSLPGQSSFFGLFSTIMEVSTVPCTDSMRKPLTLECI